MWNNHRFLHQAGICSCHSRNTTKMKSGLLCIFVSDFFLLFFDCNLDTQTHRYTEPMQAALLQGLQTTFDLTDTRVGNFFCLLKRLVNTFFTLAFSLCFIRACFRNLKKVSTRHQAWAVSIFSYLPDITQGVFNGTQWPLCSFCTVVFVHHHSVL